MAPVHHIWPFIGCLGTRASTRFLGWYEYLCTTHSQKYQPILSHPPQSRLNWRLAHINPPSRKYQAGSNEALKSKSTHWLNFLFIIISIIISIQIKRVFVRMYDFTNQCFRRLLRLSKTRLKCNLCTGINRLAVRLRVHLTGGDTLMCVLL